MRACELDAAPVLSTFKGNIPYRPFDREVRWIRTYCTYVVLFHFRKHGDQNLEAAKAPLSIALKLNPSLKAT
jgi:hypothetical protein